ncbi:MAG: T9SS type A sorting domain-containing protein [Bacteroidetes bacterium]|nr:MAG: T9SS type A sorting domain-containing protein [Bacteroidota bacterium]
MMRRWLHAWIWFLGMTPTILCQISVPEYSNAEKALHKREEERYASRFFPDEQQSVASEWLDVSFYDIKLDISVIAEMISGEVVIEGTATRSGDTFLIVDLMNAMVVYSSEVNDTGTTYLQFSSSCKIDFHHPVTAGERVSVRVRYSGQPVRTGFGSFVFSSHSETPWVWSLSEPYGARDWFPCKDHPTDKADSANITITVDSRFSVASNGNLAAIMDNGDGTKTHFWQERYPIASYLISVAITNYKQFSHWFQYSSNDSMEVLNFVLPERYASAETSLAKTVGMLEIFSDLFGMYPFVKEKYGHADFGFGGAMEHQTITSTTTYQEGVLSHELAHQWFGDMITCRTWQDLWLNEGFAQYSEALYMGKKYGDSTYKLYINAELGKARNAQGSLFVSDTTVVTKLFDAKRVYAKGASVLHMLRHVLGDSIFFRCLYNYANDTSLMYATASTEDFQRVCETTSERDLEFFFKQWVYGENYPQYSYWWKIVDSTAGYTIQLGVKQETGTVNPAVFTMPVDFRFKGALLDTMVTLLNTQSTQFYTIQLSHRPDSVKLDPNDWILKKATELSPDEQPFPFPYQFVLNQNYPNPFNVGTTLSFVIRSAAGGSLVKITVYDVLGRETKTIVEQKLPPGEYTQYWDGADLPSGVYFYRLSAVGQDGILSYTEIKKMLLVK